MTTERDPSTTDMVESLRALGFRATRDALSAFLTHAHKSRLGPTETIEHPARPPPGSDAVAGGQDGPGESWLN